MYVYRYFRDDQLYCVGFYDPAGKWLPESDHGTMEEAVDRCAKLNGGGNPVEPAPTRPEPSRLEVAALAMQGILSGPVLEIPEDADEGIKLGSLLIHGYDAGAPNKAMKLIWNSFHAPVRVAALALEMADALITAAKK